MSLKQARSLSFPPRPRERLGRGLQWNGRGRVSDKLQGGERGLVC
jgi:hypothetical protein